MRRVWWGGVSRVFVFCIVVWVSGYVLYGFVKGLRVLNVIVCRYRSMRVGSSFFLRFFLRYLFFVLFGAIFWKECCFWRIIKFVGVMGRCLSFGV